MGCDIHIIREVKDKDGVWQVSPTLRRHVWSDDLSLNTSWLPNDRDYDLFGVLSAGVRTNASISIGEDRGLPDDCTPQVYGEAESSDLHSHGYASLRELDDLWKACDGKIKSQSAYREGEPYDAELEWFFKDWVDLHLRPFAWNGPDSARIVYWFDN